MAEKYLIRSFPPTLHRLAKTVAGWEGITMRELILKALAEYLKKYQEAGGLLDEVSRLEETEEERRI
jgi:hypothetical protein